MVEAWPDIGGVCSWTQAAGSPTARPSGPSGAPHHLECSAMGRTVALPRPGTLTMLPHGARMLAREQPVRLLLLRVGLRARGAQHGRGDVHRAGQHAHRVGPEGIDDTCADRARKYADNLASSFQHKPPISGPCCGPSRAFQADVEDYIKNVRGFLPGTSWSELSSGHVLLALLIAVDVLRCSDGVRGLR